MFSKIVFLPLIARILLALLFIISGIGKIGAFAGISAYIGAHGLPIPNVIAVLTIILEVGGGILLIVGYQTRWVALAMAVFTVLAALIFHNFWSMTGAAAHANQLHFLKNLSIAGGMLMVCFFGAGPLSIDKGK